MKVLLINGSWRKNGATGLILQEMSLQFNKYDDVELELINLSDLNLDYCTGCGSCFKKGNCYLKDDGDVLSKKISESHGIIIGSPTYASNVTGQMKVVIDRCHFIIEQLLYGKYGISLTTYENYGGKDAEKVLKRLLSYSGAKISSSLLIKNKFLSNPLDNISTKNLIDESIDKMYLDIKEKRKYTYQSLVHKIIFNFGIKPFVLKKGEEYGSIVSQWENRGIRF